MEPNIDAEVRAAYNLEMRELLKTWHDLEVNPAATDRDFIRLREKILAVDAFIAALDRKGTGR